MKWKFVDDSSSDEQFEVEESISPNNETLSSDPAFWYAEKNIFRTMYSQIAVFAGRFIWHIKNRNTLQYT